jgi:hypothetical protein
VKIQQIIRESLGDWNNSIWLHYSDQPFMKINASPSHQDPAGIYLFPEKFSPHGHWTRKPYKFVVKLKPGIHVLDFAAMSTPAVMQLADQLGLGEKYRATLEQYKDYKTFDPTKPGKLMDVLWDMIKVDLHGYRRAASTNASLRRLGYDAVFDDTNSILHGEVQMLVLNPSAIASKTLIVNKKLVYPKILRVFQDCLELAKQFGKIDTVEPPKRKVDRYNPKKTTIEGTIQIVNPVNPERNYAYIKVGYNPDSLEGTVIYANLSYCSPNPNAGFGSQFSVIQNDYEHEGLSDLERGLKRVFEPAMSESTIMENQWSSDNITDMPEDEQQKVMRDLLHQAGFVASETRTSHMRAAVWHNLPSWDDKFNMIEPTWEKAGYPLPGTEAFSEFLRQFFALNDHSAALKQRIRDEYKGNNLADYLKIVGDPMAQD